MGLFGRPRVRPGAAANHPWCAPPRPPAEQEIGERYPAWLEAHRAALSAEDLERYTRQYDYIQRITGLYERDPGNLERLVGLLQEVRLGLGLRRGRKNFNSGLGLIRTALWAC